MAESFIELFETAHRRALDSQNRGDFGTAFATVSPEVEWRILDFLPDARVIKGREEAIGFLRGLRDDIDWQLEPIEYIDAGEGRVVTHIRGTAVGRTTAITTTREFYSLVEVGADGLVARIWDYAGREAAFEAARRREQIPPPRRGTSLFRLRAGRADRPGASQHSLRRCHESLPAFG